MTTVIAGFGNELRADDGVGLAVVRHIERAGVPDGCTPYTPRSLRADAHSGAGHAGHAGAPIAAGGGTPAAPCC